MLQNSIRIFDNCNHNMMNSSTKYSLLCIFVRCILSAHFTSVDSFLKVSYISRYNSNINKDALLTHNMNPQSNIPENAEVYRDPITRLLGLFIKKEKLDQNLALINWNIKKRKKTSLENLAKLLEFELGKREW